MTSDQHLKRMAEDANFKKNSFRKFEVMDRDKSIFESYRQLQDSLSVSVKISHNEVDRLLVDRLIKIRNSDVNVHRDMTHFDEVIRHFLTEDEFQKYVINKKEFNG